MAWFYTFGDINTQNNSEEQEFIFEKTQKTNLPRSYPKEIADFIVSAQSEVLGSESKKVTPNLTKEERESIKELKKLQIEGQIVIKPADKGCGIVIMDRKDYEEESYRQLNDKLNVGGKKIPYYQKTNLNKLKDQYKLLQKIIDEGVEKGHISKKTAKQLLPKSSKPGTFYLLPKMHKKYIKIPKGRPIISGCGSNTERISAFLDSQAKMFVPKIKSFVQDTPDLLRYFETINTMKNKPMNAKPFAIDVKNGQVISSSKKEL